MILFTTHTLVDSGFTSVTVKERNWVTYLQPPFLFCILLAPAENLNDFENPMKEVLTKFQPEEQITKNQLLVLYEEIVSRIGDGLRQKIIQNPVAQKLLTAIRKEFQVLRPSWSLHSGYHYPEAEIITNQSSEDTNNLLNTMMSAGLLKGQIFGNIAICPKCKSHKILLHARCPKCGLPNLESGIAIEHFTCNFTAFIEQFSTSSGLVCPNCKTTLSSGTYRSLGKVFHCTMCKSYPKIPDQILGCLECKDTFTSEQAQFKPIFSFLVNE